MSVPAPLLGSSLLRRPIRASSNSHLSINFDRFEFGDRKMMTIDEIRTACGRSEPVQLGDPVLAHFRMPLSDTFFPLGFPVLLETNSEEVLKCAAANWQGFVKLFDTPPVHLRVGVTI